MEYSYKHIYKEISDYIYYLNKSFFTGYAHILVRKGVF